MSAPAAASAAGTSRDSARSTESVVVGLRIRPLLSRDQAEGARECLLKVPNEPQVVLGGDRPFTYNHVFAPDASQTELYEGCMRPIVESVLDGYNATVLAYGQTGSGKTHTMGSAGGAEVSGEGAGLIPRAIRELFERIHAAEGIQCCAAATFIEIYKEDVHDLLQQKEDGTLATLPIRENGPDGGITLTNQKSKPVKSVDDAMGVLAEGARNRATGATVMNAHSSRSHAIFTLALELKLPSGKSFSPKLHFVDLAGSERAKRTGASGERLQEGIQINKGLLALGNVINALCEKLSHVPYRDSKLTRLLQDSLGGNSRTMMLACVSPSDSDLEETLNTLKYANRARQIRNKPVVAQDPMQAKISELNETIALLQARLAHYEGGGAPLAPIVLPGAAADASASGAAAGSTTVASAPTGGGEAAAASDRGGKAAADSVLLKRCTQLQRENETLKARITSLVRGGATVSTAAAEPSASSAEVAKDLAVGGLPPLSKLTSLDEEPMVGATTARTSSGSSGSSVASSAIGDSSSQLLEQADDSVYAQEEMEAELEFQKKQGEISEQLEGLNNSLALKQALLAQQAETAALGGDGGEGSSSGDASTEEEMSALCDALASLEAKLKGVESERDAFHRQVAELRMHSDSDGQPSKQASRKLEQLEAEIARLKRQRAQQEALLKARQASERRVKQLEGEIDSIKAQKVELSRRQREDADLHRAQRTARERELKQLKRKEEKTAAQLSKVEGEFAKQAAVLKRKNEEIAAAHKRQKQQTDMATGAMSARRPSTAAPLTARGSIRPGKDGIPTVSERLHGVTESHQAKLNGKREADIEKAVSAIGQKPREWLNKELDSVVEAAGLREQLALQIELRRQASLELSALELRAQEALETDPERNERIADLQLKLNSLHPKISGLQQRLMKSENGDATKAKLDALGNIKDARALLKAAFPQMVELQLKAEERQRLAADKDQSLKEAVEVTNNLRLLNMRQRMEFEKKARAADEELHKATQQVTELRQALSTQVSASASPPKPPAAAKEAVASSPGMEKRLDERLAAMDNDKGQLDTGSIAQKLAALKQANMPKKKQAKAARDEEDTPSEDEGEEEEEDDEGEEDEEESASEFEEESEAAESEFEDSDVEWTEENQAEGWGTKRKAAPPSVSKPAPPSAVKPAAKRAVANAAAKAPVKGAFAALDDIPSEDEEKDEEKEDEAAEAAPKPPAQKQKRPETAPATTGTDAVEAKATAAKRAIEGGSAGTSSAELKQPAEPAPKRARPPAAAAAKAGGATTGATGQKAAAAAGAKAAASKSGVAPAASKMATSDEPSRAALGKIADPNEKGGAAAAEPTAPAKPEGGAAPKKGRKLGDPFKAGRASMLVDNP